MPDFGRAPSVRAVQEFADPGQQLFTMADYGFWVKLRKGFPARAVNNLTYARSGSTEGLDLAHQGP